ncbi:hypothetical protein [Spirosoma foliorum]|uniref:Cyclophilin-like domain-containing protein n=1 Tax=Spirosoma foliorum TaxID=2710596 RepID=A0A7G5H0W3_9BACT|nr:hypothetical protein [Spirosoma foliorum]QMW04755.1 hypothetical protein H3H32_07470 [Spirosoma foliorum]
MRPRLFSLSLMAIVSLTTSLACLAQKPSYDVTIVADGKPLDLSQGIPAHTRTLQLRAQLTQNSQQQYPQLKPTVLINKAILNLVRDTRRVSFVNWPSDESVASLFKQAQVGDRFLIQFEDVESQTKGGVVQKIDNSKIVQVTVKK